MISKLFKSSYFYSIVTKGAHILLGLLISVFVNRALGTELKGEYAYVMNLVSILAIIGGLGIYQLYPFYIHNNKVENPKQKFVSLTLQIVSVYICIAAAAAAVCTVRDGFRTGAMVGMASFICIFNIASTQMLMFASVDDFIHSRFANIAAYIIKFLMAFAVFVCFRRNIWAVLLVDLSFGFFSVAFCLKILKFHISDFQSDWKFLVEILKKGWVPMLFSLLLTLNYKIDIIFMKSFSTISLASIGLYSVGIQLAEYIWTIPDMFKEVLYSKTAKKINMIETLWCMRLSIYIELVFLVFIFIFGDLLLKILYGPDFVEAISITKIMFTGVLAMTLFKVLTPLYNAKGKYVSNLLILLLSVCINITLNAILIPRFGTTGAALASVTGYCSCGLIYLVRFCVDFRVPIYKTLIFNRRELHALLKGESL